MSINPQHTLITPPAGNPPAYSEVVQQLHDMTLRVGRRDAQIGGLQRGADNLRQTFALLAEAKRRVKYTLEKAEEQMAQQAAEAEELSHRCGDMGGCIAQLEADNTRLAEELAWIKAKEVEWDAEKAAMLEQIRRLERTVVMREVVITALENR